MHIVWPISVIPHKGSSFSKKASAVFTIRQFIDKICETIGENIKKDLKTLSKKKYEGKKSEILQDSCFMFAKMNNIGMAL